MTDNVIWTIVFVVCFILAIAGIFTWAICSIEKKVNALANKFGVHVLNAEDYFKEIDNCNTNVEYLRGDFESLKHDFNLHNHKYVFEGNILYIKEPNEVD